MEKFDIPVTFKVTAKNEREAEDVIIEFLKYAQITMAKPNILDWEFTEFIPEDLKNSCCC